MITQSTSLKLRALIRMRRTSSIMKNSHHLKSRTSSNSNCQGTKKKTKGMSSTRMKAINTRSLSRWNSRKKLRRELKIGMKESLKSQNRQTKHLKNLQRIHSQSSYKCCVKSLARQPF